MSSFPGGIYDGQGNSLDPTIPNLSQDQFGARLPDREIGRRAGVSPQTVGNLRRRQAAHL